MKKIFVELLEGDREGKLKFSINDETNSLSIDKKSAKDLYRKLQKTIENSALPPIPKEIEVYALYVGGGRVYGDFVGYFTTLNKLYRYADRLLRRDGSLGPAYHALETHVEDEIKDEIVE